MLFDTHAHYDSNQFKDDRMEVLAALPQAGPSPEEEDPGISQMLENLDAFL